MTGDEPAGFLECRAMSRAARAMLAEAGQMFMHAGALDDLDASLRLKQNAMALQRAAIEMLKRSNRLAVEQIERQRAQAAKQIADLRQM